MNAPLPVAVWDFPTRLFHWLLVLLLAFSWWSAENGVMDWHYRSGLTMLGLLVFRLIWGFIGGSTARFGHFVRAPAAALDHLRRPGDEPPRPGHNPFGGYAVITMLVALAAQVGFGLFAVDIDGLESGPLSHLVSFDQGRAAAELHEIAFNFLLALIALHVAAIVYYRFRRGRKLTGPMLVGRDAQLPHDADGLVRAGPLRLAFAVIVAALVATWIGGGLGG